MSLLAFQPARASERCVRAVRWSWFTFPIGRHNTSYTLTPYCGLLLRLECGPCMLLLWAYDEQWQLRAIKHAFHNAAQHPVLQATAPMRRQGEQITRLEGARVIAKLRRPDQCVRHILTRDHGVGDLHTKFCRQCSLQFALERPQ